ncbi:MAG: discoidin domain-containing protein [Polyangiaceae bacterium]
MGIERTMSLGQSLAGRLSPITEFFTLGRAESTIRGYEPAQRARVQEHAAAADRRAWAGRRTTQAVAAAVLLREAVTLSLHAAACARDAGVDLDALDLATAMPPLPPDPARPRAEPTDDARVREALTSRDALYFDRLDPEDAERARWALDRAASLVRQRVEARSLTNVRGVRWGRFAALLLVIGYVAFMVTRALVFPKNIALGKPVHPSSRKHNPPDGKELVDGEIGTSFGIHTNVEDSPNVVIDLQGRYWIDSVKVYNRVDGWFDDSLPLVVELSQDGNKWDEIGRREEHFDASPPWVVNGRGKPAEFVRVRVARKSYLAISEVEVYGKKF